MPPYRTLADLPKSQVDQYDHHEKRAFLEAFNHAWETFFREGDVDHDIKELCRLYISKSVDCEYCGGQRSVTAAALGTRTSAARTAGRSRRRIRRC